MSTDALEGRIRAIEAILLELDQVTPEVVEAAKARIRDPKYQRDAKIAEMKKIGGRLDEHAEKALDDLRYRAEQRRGERERTSRVDSR